MSYSHPLIRVAFTCLVGLTTISAVWGQATTSLRGIVSDSQGAAVESANATLENDQTGFKRSVITDSTGAYQFLQIPPGGYVIVVEKPGFRSDAAEVELLINTPSTLNVQLTLGSVRETVDVMAETTTINTQNADIGNPFNETQVKEIPLQTRNVVALLGVQAGVSSSGQVLGSRPDQNNVLLDGVDVNDNQGANGFNAVLPIPLDSVQEFRTTVAGLNLPSSVRVVYGGTYEEQQKSSRELARVLFLALALVFGVLLAEFRNFSAPIAILTSSVLSLGGVVRHWEVWSCPRTV